MKIEVASPKKANRSITLNYDLFVEADENTTSAEALAKNVENFGADVVLSLALAEGIVKFQARARSYLEQGIVSNAKGEIVGERLNDTEIQEKMDEWKPGVVTTKKTDKVQEFVDLIKTGKVTLDGDSIQALIEQLKAKAAEASGE